jgi:hypothetical protein
MSQLFSPSALPVKLRDPSTKQPRLEGTIMSRDETEPRELTTGRGNFMTVLLNLATGQVRVLDDAEAANAAAEATRRQASTTGEVLLLSSSAS